MSTLAQEKVTSSPPEGYEEVQKHYLESLSLVERLNRRLLEVVKNEFDRTGSSKINAIQALLLFNIGGEELSAGELRSRGYYQGSNVSYNLKKLVDLGYIHHRPSKDDRRSVRIKLTEKGQEIHDVVEGLYNRHVLSIEKVGGLSPEEFQTMNESMQRLERFWTDQILYRL